MHEYIPVIILVIGLFACIWINRRDFTDLKSDMNRQFDAVNKHLDRIDADLREFYGTDKQLEGRVNELSPRIK